MKTFDPFPACLYCEAPIETFEPGPRGGASQNMTCSCGARYNLLMVDLYRRHTGPLFLEVLSPPRDAS